MRVSVNLDGLHKVPKKLASGKRVYYYYAWRGGPRLLADLLSQEFVAEYQAAWKARFAPASGTVSSLIYDYQTSKQFEILAKLTKRDHLAVFKAVEPIFGDMPLEALEDRSCRKDFKEWRDTIQSDRQADKSWSTMRRVFSVAVDNGILTWNPCSGGGKRYTGERSNFLWSDAQISQFRLSAPKHVSLPLIIALNTGQRQGDILRLKWSDYDGERIRLTQSKTGRKVSVLINDELKAVLDGLDKKSIFVCVNSRGRPWTSLGFQASFRKARLKSGVEGVTFHDLRGTFITRRHNEGSSLENIAGIVGLSTKDISKVMERHYLGADDARSDAVILRMGENRK